MADSAVLREYLVSLGFQIDKTGEKKANNALNTLDKQAANLGKSVVGVATAVTGMVTVFAYQMEKLYYSSMKTNSTVGSLQALEYGARQIGISGDSMRSSLEGMSRALRANPGLNGLLKHLGVDAQGKEGAQVFMELLTQLKQMPFFVAAKYGKMFGIPEDELFLALQGLDQLKAKENERLERMRALGVDMDQLAKNSVTYTNGLRDTSDRIGLLSAVVMDKLLPAFNSVNAVLGETLDKMIKVYGKAKSPGDVADLTKYLFLKGAKDLLGLDNYEPSKPDFIGGGAAPQAAGNPQEILRALEKKYSLPSGLLDRVWAAESNRNDPRFMTSKAGAQGPFQFMPKTAKEYGVTDPFNFSQASEGAARKYADLLRMYKGDVGMAAAAYNYGEGNLASKGITSTAGLGRAPLETQGYVSKVAGVTQTNSIVIQGGDSSSATQRMLLDTMRINNADLVRQMNVRAR